MIGFRIDHNVPRVIPNREDGEGPRN